jgi:hypothetical protein
VELNQAKGGLLGCAAATPKRAKMRGYGAPGSGYMVAYTDNGVGNGVR